MKTNMALLNKARQHISQKRKIRDQKCVAYVKARDAYKNAWDDLVAARLVGDKACVDLKIR